MTIDVSQIKTLQDVINVLSVVCFNMNEIERTYYDMFINPVPTDVTLQRYDDQGVLQKIVLPNRAKDHQDVLTGEGSPEGIIEAAAGRLYLDTASQDLYYKSIGVDAYGWLKIYSTLNLSPNTDFLKPDGDGSQLTNLNMSHASSGVLAVDRGGTGNMGITGLVKGNGTSPYSTAIDGVDYMGASSMTGIIAYFPVENIPVGWLKCDGSAYSRTTYARLFNAIGTTYGNGDGSTTFNVPNLYNYFVRCWDGERNFNSVQEGQVGEHVHPLTGQTATESAHTHTRGDMNITGEFGAINTKGGFTAEGAFYDKGRAYDCDWDNIGGRLIGFEASRTWTGETSGGSPHSHALTGNTSANATDESKENRVKNMALVPVIKY